MIYRGSRILFLVHFFFLFSFSYPVLILVSQRNGAHNTDFKIMYFFLFSLHVTYQNWIQGFFYTAQVQENDNVKHINQILNTVFFFFLIVIKLFYLQ